MSGNQPRKGQLIVLSAPSGTGKSTVLKQLFAQRSNIYFSVSYTTRKPREGEVDGVTYNFVTREEFERMIAAGELLEYAEYVGNYYGTSLKAIQDRLEGGVDVLLEIEVKGAAQIRQRCPDALYMFMIPPSFADLEQRLRGRNTDDEQTILKRLAQAREEYKQIPNYDYLVVNDTVSNAVAQMQAILTAAECRMENRKYIVEGDKTL